MKQTKPMPNDES